MISLRAFFAALVLSFVAACASTPDTEAQRASTILISIDGFRADYLDRGHSPTLSRLAVEGARASMRPSFPSNTFPNHYALATGLVPDHSGIVNNRMEAPERPGQVFTMGNRAVASDPFWWTGVPIWVSAERQGVRTGTMFWPGSDYELHGVRPSQWVAFNQALPGEERVDTVLSWFDLPAGERPLFFTLYFDIVDTAGHRNGPDGPETNQAIALVDAQIGRLVDGLAARGLTGKVNLVVVADHGMTAISDGRIIDLDAIASQDLVRVVWDGPFAGVEPRPGQTEAAEAALLGRKEHMECWRKGELPARFKYGTNPRVPPIICRADLGWRMRTAAFPAYAGPNLGAHGFDPAEPDMAAMFVAHGPDITRGVTLAPFDNVSVYPLLTHLLGIEGEAGDGRLADVEGALAAR